MRESTVERYLVQEVKKRGGKAYKWISPGNRGVHDRIVLFPNKRVYFVELKAPGGKLRPEQIQQHRTILDFGHASYVLSNCLEVDFFLYDISMGI